MDIDNKEISAYIKSVLEGIEQGLSAGYFVSSGVRFEMGLRNVSNVNGGIKVMIVGVGAERSKESDVRVVFEVMSPLALAEKDEASSYAKSLVEGADMSKALGLTTTVVKVNPSQESEAPK